MRQISVVIFLMLITFATKAQSDSVRKTTITSRSDSGKAFRVMLDNANRRRSKNKALLVYYFRGKTVNKPDTNYTYQLTRADTADIKDIEIVSGAKSIAKYGKQGKNGAVEIYLKDNNRRTYRRLKSMAKKSGQVTGK